MRFLLGADELDERFALPPPPPLLDDLSARPRATGGGGEKGSSLMTGFCSSSQSLPASPNCESLLSSSSSGSALTRLALDEPELLLRLCAADGTEAEAEEEGAGRARAAADDEEEEEEAPPSLTP